MTTEEAKSVQVSNYHALFYEVLVKRFGFWGSRESPRISGIKERDELIRPVIGNRPSKEKGKATASARNVLALRRFNAEEFLGQEGVTLSDEELKKAYEVTVGAFRTGRVHYDDFGPLVLHLFETHKYLLQWMRRTYPVVIFDEFQDTDVLQWQIVQLWRPSKVVILCDRFQMIYGWRGARPDMPDKAIKTFEIEERSIEKLTTSHRTGAAKEMAEFFLQLRSDGLMGGSVLHLVGGWGWLTLIPSPGSMQSVSSEARAATSIRFGRVIVGTEATAILCRTNYMARRLRHILSQKPSSGEGPWFPCRYIGSNDSPEEVLRDEIRRLEKVADISGLKGWLGYLVDNVLLPTPYTGISFEAELTKSTSQILASRKKKVLVNIRDQITPWWDSITLDSPERLARAFRAIIGIAEGLAAGTYHFNPDAISFVRALAKAVERVKTGGSVESMCSLLERAISSHSYLYLRARPRGVYLMTVHQAKGREFDHVIIPWLSGHGEPALTGGGGRMPMAYDPNSDEDRRLLYVALTRARSRVTVCYPEEDPSPFLQLWKLMA